jgi:hypothetical protein
VPIETILRDYCEPRQEELVDLTVRCVLASVNAKDIEATAQQSARGFVSLFLEHLRGGATPTRDFWLETLFPSLLAQGETVPNLVRTGTMINVAFALQIVPALPAEARAEASAWLARFLGELQADVVRVCMEASRA